MLSKTVTACLHSVDFPLYGTPSTARASASSRVVRTVSVELLGTPKAAPLEPTLYALPPSPAAVTRNPHAAPAVPPSDDVVAYTSKAVASTWASSLVAARLKRFW